MWFYRCLRSQPCPPQPCLWLHSWLLFSIREKKGWLKAFGGGLVWDWVVVLVCPILSQTRFIQEGCWPVVTAIICKVPLLSAFYAFHCPTYRGGCRPDLCTQREKKLCARIMAYIDQRHTPESRNYKTVRGKQRKAWWQWMWQWFLNMTPKAQAAKEKIEILNCIEIKTFYVSKDTIRVNRQPMEWEKILANHISDMGLISRILKELLQSNSRKKKNQTAW